MPRCEKLIFRLHLEPELPIMLLEPQKTVLDVVSVATVDELTMLLAFMFVLLIGELLLTLTFMSIVLVFVFFMPAPPYEPIPGGEMRPGSFLILRLSDCGCGCETALTFELLKLLLLRRN